MIDTLSRLPADTRAAALAWLDGVLAGVDADLRASLRDELTTALCEALGPNATPEDLVHVVTGLGPIATDESGAGDRDPRVGTWCGIPFDWRPPTGERIRDRLWDPRSTDLLVPRAFGAGWDVNLGALAVRLGLIEPDAEDDPFSATPHDAFVLAAGFPALMAAAVLAHYAVRGRSLPGRLPSHWTLDGTPDRWVSKPAAAALDSGVAVVAALVATLAAGSRSNGAGRAARTALAAGAAGGAAVTTVVRAARRPHALIGPAVLAGMVLPVAGTLYGLALAGRDAEHRRDLGR